MVLVLVWVLVAVCGAGAGAEDPADTTPRVGSPDGSTLEIRAEAVHVRAPLFVEGVNVMELIRDMTRAEMAGVISELSMLRAEASAVQSTLTAWTPTTTTTTTTTTTSTTSTTTTTTIMMTFTTALPSRLECVFHDDQYGVEKNNTITIIDLLHCTNLTQLFNFAVWRNPLLTSIVMPPMIAFMTGPINIGNNPLLTHIVLPPGLKHVAGIQIIGTAISSLALPPTLISTSNGIVLINNTALTGITLPEALISLSDYLRIYDNPQLSILGISSNMTFTAIPHCDPISFGLDCVRVCGNHPSLNIPSKITTFSSSCPTTCTGRRVTPNVC
jgi:hypothetical protein